MTLDYGKAQSEAARAAYQAKINDFVGNKEGLSNGLIGLGALILGLSAGDVHRDAILGTSLLGGTALVMGNWNLDQRRLVIYHAAVAAFNCADRAVEPLNMWQSDLDTLQTELKDLAAANAEAANSIATTEIELAKWMNSTQGLTESAKSIETSIAAAKQAQTVAKEALANGYTLRRVAMAAGENLANAVRTIQADADKALGDTLGDLTKVPSVIAGLAGAAGSLVPGSSVGSVFTDALKNAGMEEGLKAIDVPPPALVMAHSAMNASIAKLAMASAIVQARVQAYALGAQADKLADCGIGDLSFPLSASPARLTVPAGIEATTTVIISGGKAPYAVKVNGIKNSGIKIDGPDRLDNSFEVQIPATLGAAQVLNYRIVDSSSPTRDMPFAVEITGIPRTDAVVTKDSGTASVNETDALKAALQGVSSFKAKTGKGVDITVTIAGDPSVEGTTIRVPVTCQPNKNAGLTQVEMLEGLKASLGNNKGLLDGKTIKFENFVAGETCVNT